MYTVLLNALPTLFTFLRIKGMPAHGNATEQEFHNGYAKQRRVRRQIKNQKGALFLGVHVSVVGTCRKRGIPFSAAFLHLLLVEPLRRQAIPHGSPHNGHGQRQASEAGDFGTHQDKAPARNPAGRGGSGRVIRRLGGGPSLGASRSKNGWRRPRGHSFEGRILAPAPGAKSPHSYRTFQRSTPWRRDSPRFAPRPACRIVPHMPDPAAHHAPAPETGRPPARLAGSWTAFRHTGITRKPAVRAHPCRAPPDQRHSAMRSVPVLRPDRGPESTRTSVSYSQIR